VLLRTDPFRELDRFATQVLGTPNRPAAMPLDAYRLGEEFVMELDLPGIDADSIELTVEKNVLTISAERRRASAEASELLIGERPHGMFRRQLFLGEGLDTDRIEATYRDGVLTVSLPVAERARPRRIPVQAADAPVEANAELTASTPAA
jgi:HSP20 family protein